MGRKYVGTEDKPIEWRELIEQSKAELDKALKLETELEEGADRISYMKITQACLDRINDLQSTAMNFLDDDFKPTPKTETLCVGPIWSHNDFLSRREELTQFGKDKLGPNWEIEGNWWSENGTSFV